MYVCMSIGIHWYGKFDSRVGRKMAHVTITADDISSLIDKGSADVHIDMLFYCLYDNI